jgi:hypothetical protein
VRVGGEAQAVGHLTQLLVLRDQGLELLQAGDELVLGAAKIIKDGHGCSWVE